MFRRRLPLTVVMAMGLMLSVPLVARAGLISDGSDGFEGWYALEPVDGNQYGNWTLSGEGDYGVEQRPDGSIRLIAETGGGNVEFEIVIPVDGEIEFSWELSGEIDAGSEGGPFNYLLNGVPILPPGPSLIVTVQQGWRFAFRFAPGSVAEGEVYPPYVEISNFSGPLSSEPIPEPSTLALLGLGIAGLGVRQTWLRRKARRVRT